MTVAERVSALFDDNSRVWQKGGIHLYDECERLAIDEDQDWDRKMTRYIFEDDSAIVFAGKCWDIGRSDCFCPASSPCKCE